MCSLAEHRVVWRSTESFGGALSLLAEHRVYWRSTESFGGAPSRLAEHRVVWRSSKSFGEALESFGGAWSCLVEFGVVNICASPLISAPHRGFSVGCRLLSIADFPSVV